MFWLLLAGLGALTLKGASAPAGAISGKDRLRYLNAISSDPSAAPEALTALSKEFDEKGFRAEADILRKRARNANFTPEQKNMVTTAFRNAMSSKDPIAVRTLATAMEAEAYFGNAHALREWANNLDTGAVLDQQQALTASVEARRAAIAAATPAQIAQAAKAVKADQPLPPPVTPTSAKDVIASASPDELAKAKAAVEAEIGKTASSAIGSVASGLAGAVSSIPGGSDAVNAGAKAAESAIPSAVSGPINDAVDAVTKQAGQVLGSIL